MPRSTPIQLRQGTAAVWTALNPTLAAGEPGFESDTGKVKIGDGSTAWTGLAYVVTSATTSLSGAVELATEAEHRQASSATLAVTPAASVYDRPWSRQWGQMTPQSGTTIRHTGAGVNLTPTGTVAMVTAAAGLPFHATITGAASAATATVTCDQGNYLVRRGANSSAAWGGFDFVADVAATDASYDESGASTGSRIHVGLTSGTMAQCLSADYGRTSDSAAFFAREHVNGGALDTNWQFCTQDQTAKANVDTGMPFTPSNLYRFRIYCPVGGATVYWWIWDLTAGTSASGSTSTSIPLTTTNMRWGIGLYTVDAVARRLGLVSVFASNDK